MMSSSWSYYHGKRQVFSVLLLRMLFGLMIGIISGRQISSSNYEEKAQFSIFNGASFLCPDNGTDSLSLDSIREILEGLEDTIIFSLIERAKFPLNSPAYAPNHYTNPNFPAFHGSLMEFLVRTTEAVNSQGGRYQSPEEVPFFPDHLPPSLLNRRNCSQELPSVARSVNVSKNIWDSYLNKFLPLLVSEGDDGNYALSIAADLVCLQAISRRIHYGKFVAEAKFRSATQTYTAAIQSKDTNTITKLLTNEKVEAMVKERVEKKSMIFGQDVTLDNTNNSSKSNVDPSVITRLYEELVIPLTKGVEVEYLLRRLDD